MYTYNDVEGEYFNDNPTDILGLLKPIRNMLKKLILLFYPTLGLC